MLIHQTLAIRAPSDNLSIDAHQLVLDSSNPASPTQDHVDPGSAGSAIQNSSQLAAECITRSNSMGPQYPLSSKPAFGPSRICKKLSLVIPNCSKQDAPSTCTHRLVF